jgi:hypothetical protein
MPLFFLPYLCSMNALLQIRDTSQRLYYIPTYTLQNVRRINATTIRVFTNILAHDNNTNPEYMSYDIIESGAGSGASDTTQVQLFINAWESALSSSGTLFPIAFSITIDRVDYTSSAWV